MTLMAHGHTPSEIDAMPWRDAALFLQTSPMIAARERLLGGQR